MTYYINSSLSFGEPTNYHTYVDHYIIPSPPSSPAPLTTPAPPLIAPHRQFYLSDVNAYSLIPLRSTIKVFVVPIDVIHPLGFYSFGIKIDAIPGRINPASSSRSIINSPSLLAVLVIVYPPFISESLFILGLHY